MINSKFACRRKILLLLIPLLFSVFLGVSQEITIIESESIDSAQAKCLYKQRHFVSTNIAQYVVGIANVQYELFIVPQVSMKFAVGSTMGYRLLVNKFESTQPGGLYAMVEPRWFTYESTQNCWMNLGFGLSYKLWDYTEKEIISDTNAANQEPTKSYKEIHQREHLVSASFIGKHIVSGSVAFEYQLGAGAGVKNNSFIVSPQVGLSLGWIF